MEPYYQDGWVICGGESGSGARGFDCEWARALRDSCKRTGKAFFMKQLGEAWSDSNVHHHTPKNKWDEPKNWPVDLQIREFPKLSPALPSDVVPIKSKD